MGDLMILECKVCGGNLIPIDKDSKICKCENCGKICVIPNVMDNETKNLLNKANAERINCEFDRAIASYTALLNKDNSNCDAHWGLLLSRYGVEYIIDSDSNRKTTCHRTQFDTIFNDIDYKLALENTTDEGKQRYKDDAQEIDDIQKRIKETISSNDYSYDVFICYKDTTENKRTRDSRLAESIYNEITRLGYKVFFSRFSLEEKLGDCYEPIIFSALQSAKVLLLVAYSQENMESVWVKNEWSRYRNLIKDKKKAENSLIPVYCEMNPDDFPIELQGIQGVDASVPGYLQDICRGIEKITNKGSILNTAKVISEPTINKKDLEEIVTKSLSKNLNMVSNPVTSPTTISLLKRADLFLADRNYDKVIEYCDKVLDMDSESSRAYWLLLMAKNYVNSENDLISLDENIEKTSEFKRAVEFSKSEEEALAYKEVANKIFNDICNKAEYFVQDKNFEEAIKFCDKILDIDHSNSRAYWLLLLAENKVSNDNELIDLEINLDKSPLYQKALEFSKTEQETDRYKELSSAILTNIDDKAKKYLESRDYDKAIIYIDKMLEINEKDSSAYWMKLLAVNNVSDDYELVAKELNILSSYFYDKAMEYASVEEEEHYKKITTDNYNNLISLQEKHFTDRKYEKTIEYCNKVLEIDSKNSRTYWLKFLSKMAIGQLNNDKELTAFAKNVNNSFEYKKAIEFAKTKQEQDDYIQSAKVMQTKIVQDQIRKTDLMRDRERIKEKMVDVQKNLNESGKILVKFFTTLFTIAWLFLLILEFVFIGKDMSKLGIGLYIASIVIYFLYALAFDSDNIMLSMFWPTLVFSRQMKKYNIKSQIVQQKKKEEYLKKQFKDKWNEEL